ncbi:MAG: toll/interleukin-1 receptor domain-containing protein [Proteobacteria bacterium]|nr:toll/interleukin-1 receptor domain-containing protein [Pseudomonadota bacterium]
MADVFISYSREDRARAEQVARGLSAMGLEAFWDTDIPPGQTWADYIEGKLAQCKAVVVLWSEHSTKSQWVREEARMGRDKSKLIPAMLEASPPPFGFGEVQAADLSAWRGEPNHPEWARLSAAVRNAVGAPEGSPAVTPQQSFAPPPAAAPVPSMAQQTATRAGVPAWAWIAGGVVAAILAIAVIGPMLSKQGQSAQQAVYDPQQAGQPVANAPAQSGQVPPQSAQILMQQLQQAEQAAAQQGFQRVGQPFAGGLTQGQSWNVPAQLFAGYEYRVLGVCDQSCRDMDIAVYDQSGATIGQDNANDDHPAVEMTPAVNGQFTIQAQMFQCSAQPCYYALVLYGRARQ